MPTDSPDEVGKAAGSSEAARVPFELSSNRFIRYRRNSFFADDVHADGSRAACIFQNPSGRCDRNSDIIVDDIPFVIVEVGRSVTVTTLRQVPRARLKRVVLPFMVFRTVFFA